MLDLNNLVDRLGNKIEVGTKVVILKLPIVKDHEFVDGVVVRITPKILHIHVESEDKQVDGGAVKKIYKRYPYQMFVKG